MKKLILFFLICIPCLLMAQPKREIRAVWLSTNWKLDWPSTSDAAQQRVVLRRMLDDLASLNFNMVIFQVQCRSDVLWDSEYQPWSRFITDVPGKDPGYDLLQFVIDECRERGLEVHAWVVPYPLGNDDTVKNYGDQHVINTKPDLCVKHGNDYYLDPGLPETTEYLLELYGELIDKYDFDGINLDYTRYSGSGFPDDASYNLYGNGMNKADWRRNNINKFVHALYDMVKEKRPDMKVGAAPIGAYESLPNAGGGWYAYSDVYQDPVEWMASEKLDFNAPQVYWTSNYDPHLKNWIAKSNGRHTIAGLAAYKMIDESWTASVLTNQIEQAREWGADGVCFFRTAHITGNTKGLADLLKENQFKYPAHIHPMDWYEATQPGEPKNLIFEGGENFTYTLSWEESEMEENNFLRYYSVYASTSENIDFDDAATIAIRSVIGNTVEFTVPDPSKDYYIAVTAFDKRYYESNPSNIIKIEGDPTLSVAETKVALEILQSGETLSITSDIQINTLCIYSINGTMIKYESSAANEINLNVASLHRGVYIVVVELANGEIVKQKLIK